MMTESGQRWTTLLAVAGCGLTTAWFWFAFDARVVHFDVAVLALCVAVANLLSVRWKGPLWVSGSFTFSMLAAVLQGPAAAFAVAFVGEFAAWAVERYRLTAMAINLLGSGLPNLVAATLLTVLFPPTAGDLDLVLAVAAVGTMALTANFLIVAGLTALEAGDRRVLRPPRHLLPCLAWNVGVTALMAVVFRHSEMLVGGTLALAALMGFTYMLRLSARERRAAEATATSSLGLVESLVRTLEDRDPAAARHAAAVACFANDIARRSGMSEKECGWAHLAGLLHDIGKMGLSDEAAAGSTPLELRDWATIRRHPERGAEMVQQLGPVSRAIRSHHERIDGRGYPDGRAGNEIPALARIVAVAEVYDTLTATDGYRGGLSSFQALRELRRASSSQLDPGYVEVLSQLLSGRSTDYRHGADASVNTELRLERTRLLADAE